MIKWFDFPDVRFIVNGLAWFEEEKPSVRRLPVRLKGTFRESLWDLAQNPAGGRIRFRTNALKIGIKTLSPDNAVMHHITLIGTAGFDIYADDTYFGSTWPGSAGKNETEWIVGNKRKMRDITIHLPIYKNVEIKQIGVEKDATIKSPTPFAIKKPVVFYGTSITQGGCASNPGGSYQAFLSRSLNLDFINLGFSSNGMGEPEMAHAICEIDSSFIILDHWANIRLGLKENLPVFTGVIRKKFPKTPIAVVSPFFYSSVPAERENSRIRKDAEEFVRQRRREGDCNIHLIDGLKLLSQKESYGLVDGVHCNTLGFYFIARGMEPYFKKILSL
ncbi:MAG: SGNH/GDSL hydrolase family protein [Candidatus Omnitrophota bacterium]